MPGKQTVRFTLSLTCILALGVTFVALTGASEPSAAPAAAAAWPQFRGPERNAISAESGLRKSWEGAPPKLAWQSSGLGAGFSSMSIAGDRIYTMGDLGDEQFIFGLNRADGKILWKTKIGPSWDDQYPGPRGTPTIDGDRLYAIGTEGDLLCLNRADGSVAWKKSLPNDFGGRVMTVWKYAESPLVDGDRVVVTPGGPWAGLVALDKASGKTIWASEIPSLGPKGRDGAGYSSVVISNGAGVKQYVQMMGKGLVGVRASDGKFLWGYNNVANNVANIPTPIISGDFVFASTSYSTGAALLRLVKDGEGVKAEEVYFMPFNQFQNHHGGMVLVGGYIYAGHGHNRGFPICIEMSTGKVAWGGDIRNSGTGSAAVLYADGNLYFRYQNGVMMLIGASPSGYQEKGSFTIPNVNKPSWSHPVILDGTLYLREQDALYAYNLK
ncbi:MAG TPA: PQQ-binding-like beta-propeller repeat protein [Candidatus Acidoferrales bacterium]